VGDDSRFIGLAGWAVSCVDVPDLTGGASIDAGIVHESIQPLPLRRKPRGQGLDRLRVCHVDNLGLGTWRRRRRIAHA
jgi:hypothetical protein